MDNRLIETQVSLHGEGRFCHISGRIRFSPMGCGSAMQAHLCGLPVSCGAEPIRLGLYLEEKYCCGRIPLPVLTAYNGEALMTAYVPILDPCKLEKRCVVLTVNPCGNGYENEIARGEVCPCMRPDRCLVDCRPIFAPSVHCSPYEPFFY